MLAHLVGAAVRIRMSFPPDLWNVTADPGQMEQVIVNLVVNARDAMPKGGRIEIEAENVVLQADRGAALHEARPGPHVRLSVRDTGDGIPPEVMGRLFEAFFTTKEPGRGTGLGLSTVHGIVREAGGAIEVSSELGRGTTFQIYVPRGGDSPSAELADKAVLPVQTPQGETVLLVDDQESVRYLASAILQSSGFKVLTADDGAEALRISESYAEPIDVLLTDFVMRTMTGVELAGLVRRHHPEVRLLLMSGYAVRSPELNDLITAGLPFLEKPFSVDSLKRKLGEVLAKTPPRGDA